jgi:hypothetical protein
LEVLAEPPGNGGIANRWREIGTGHAIANAREILRLRSSLRIDILLGMGGEILRSRWSLRTNIPGNGDFTVPAGAQTPRLVEYLVNHNTPSPLGFL